jgi:hypothetical protein
MKGITLHSNVQLNPVDTKVRFYEGDYVVYVNQPINRYIVETLRTAGRRFLFCLELF